MVFSDRGIDDGLSEQRCARCQQIVPTSEIVQVSGVGQICSVCDEELSTPNDEVAHG